MVRANIIVTPEKKRAIKKGNITKCQDGENNNPETKTEQSWIASTQTYRWKVLVGLKKMV